MMPKETNKLSCLYYPFSRLLEATTLKYLLLVFDNVTFLDDIYDPEWRAYQLKRLAKENEIFSIYQELADDYNMLSNAKAVQIFNPSQLKATNSLEVAIATLADLSDSKFVSLASRPSKFGLPSRPLGKYGMEPTNAPTWQIFPGKIAAPLINDQQFLNESRWKSHIFVPGNDRRHWTLSYEAGSASALNFYLEAAQELQLTPVTTSQLHHELVLRKLKRIFAEDDSKVDFIDDFERKRFRTILSQGEIVRVFSEMFPASLLEQITFSDIMDFREKTKELRHAFIAEIDNTIRAIDHDPAGAEYDKEIIVTIQSMKKNFHELENELIAIRNQIFPAIAKAFMYGAASGSALGAWATFLGGLSSGGVVAASALTTSGAFLAEAVEIWNNKRKLLRTQSSAVSYLTKVSKFLN